MIGKIRLIVLLGCVLAETNPPLARYKRRTPKENEDRLAAARKQANAEIQAAHELSQMKMKHTDLKLKIYVLTAMDELGAAATKSMGDYTKSLGDLGTQAIKSGGDVGNAIAKGGFKTGTSLINLGEQVIGSGGAVISEGVRDVSEISAGVTGTVTQAVTGAGNIVSKSVKYTSNTGVLTANLASEVIKKSEKYAGAALDNGSNAVHGLIEEGTRMIAPGIKPVTKIDQPVNSGFVTARNIGSNAAKTVERSVNQVGLLKMETSKIVGLDDISNLGQFDLDDE